MANIQDRLAGLGEADIVGEADIAVFMKYVAIERLFVGIMRR